jgi:hypothetical protein
MGRHSGFKALQADFPPLPSPPIPGTEPEVSEPPRARALWVCCPLECGKAAQVAEKLSDEIVLAVCRSCGVKFTLYCDERTVSRIAEMNDRALRLAPLDDSEGVMADG